ncbi:MAG: PilX N-terminal domain-containing pilus assembly protein [Pseudomonadota bacterium]
MKTIRSSYRKTQPFPSRQRGFTLLLAMVMILVMTVFGVFALNSSILQNRMAANYRDDKVSFEGAELATRWGETFLQSRTPAQRPFPCQTIDPSDPAAQRNCAAPGTVLAAGFLIKSSPDIPDVEERNPFNDTEVPSYWVNSRLYGEDPSAQACQGNNTVSSGGEGNSICVLDAQYDLRAAARNERGLAEQPRYLLEEVFVDRDDLAGNPQQGRVFYRIYGASTGERANTVSVVQSAVAKRYQ